ncbi:hypothetical protein Q3V23_00265 [Streptomyces sp. VNUA116]|uniref:hypothetical protein n=1 Tax=Streptomyces sp. VNUA116 TaxID=3062449 RepID=UPI002676AD66|nr:hypothetical protein [Streptomyces sp. VNUA116]WKU42631.1 hypothetical protein Q3V23_00265 [Streptomyces sp. VNUA116]
MSARHARDDAIDTTHPARAFLALAAVAVGVPAGVLHEQADGALDHSPAPVRITAAEPALCDAQAQPSTHPSGGCDA